MYDCRTHRDGGNLDEVLTNLPVEKSSLVYYSGSDHYALVTCLKLCINSNDVNFLDPELYQSQKSLRDAACSKGTGDEIVENPSLLNNPLKQIIQHKVEWKNKLRH